MPYARGDRSLRRQGAGFTFGARHIGRCGDGQHFPHRHPEPGADLRGALGRFAAVKLDGIEPRCRDGFSDEGIVGIDEDGDEQTSCTVEPAAVTPGLKKLSGNARREFDILVAMAPQNDPIHVDDWRAECQKEFLGKSRSSFHDLKKQLESKGYIDVDSQDRATRRMA